MRWNSQGSPTPQAIHPGDIPVWAFPNIVETFRSDPSPTIVQLLHSMTNETDLCKSKEKNSAPENGNVNFLS